MIQLSITCVHCEAPIHLNGLVESVQCDKCQNVIPLSVPVWQRFLTDEISVVVEMGEGKGDSKEWLSEPAARLLCAYLPAFCAQCDAKFPPLDPATLDGQVFCGQCGQRANLRAAPAWAKQIHADIAWILGETLLDNAAPLSGTEPLTVHCIACGGHLIADGSSRELICNFCQAQNFLPDQLWLRLHPAPVRKPWFLQLVPGDMVA